jgi:serine protease Do
MHRHLVGYSLVLAVAFLTPLAAEYPTKVQDVLALEATIEEAIARAEPSIVCVIVSRSEKYDNLESDAERKRAEKDRESGKLGTYELRPERPMRPGGFHRPFDPRATARDPLDLSDPENVPEAYGSGVVVDAGGLILTNYHVIRDATKIYVRLPGGKGSYADIHAADPRSDLAVLRLLDQRITGLKALKRGDTSKLKKGQFILSLANPYAAGFRDGSPSASWGILSNMRRRPPGSPNELERVKNLHNYGTLLQLDARLNLGCSGGALLNLQGDLIGLTTAEAALSGVEQPGGFAIPMDEGMWRIVEKLKQGEEVEYGFLGVRFQQPGRAPSGVERDGVLIEERIEGSPADEAGLKANDVIMTIDGVRVKEPEDLFVVIGTQLAGRKVEVEVKKNTGGEAWEKHSVKLAKFNVPADANRRPIYSKQPAAVGGLRVDYTSLLVQRTVFDPRQGRHIPAGVLIREVVPGSPADAAQLQVDKVITQVNGQRVTTPTEFYLAMENARKTGKPVELLVLNFDGAPDTVTLKLR